MRSLVIGGLLGLPLLIIGAQMPAQAGYCAVLNVGGTTCGFTTFQQCMATVSGIGGSCYQTPDPAPAKPQGTKKKKRG